jgi:RES domain-containing protein
MRLWRICRRSYAAGAFSGEGARLYGGRWNNQGISIVYASTSLALAAVETFVNLDPKLQPDDLVSIEAQLPEDVAFERLELGRLPRRWYERPESLRDFGDEWIRRAATVALHVPSAAIRGEWNVLINPSHQDFYRIRIQAPKRFVFDSRMFR